MAYLALRENYCSHAARNSDGVSLGTIHTGHNVRELLMLLHRPLKQDLSVMPSILNGNFILRK